jgi:type II pantothenate kinase
MDGGGRRARVSPLVSPSRIDAPPDAATDALAGVDVGASLVKLALRRAGDTTALETHPAAQVEAVARRLEAAGATRVALTGGGAPRLSRLLACDKLSVSEFDAWSRGARSLLRDRGAPLQRFLLVSVGTGTSAMLVDGEQVQRVGGTALGGGTLLGLGRALLGGSDFEQIAALAATGDRRRVDLLISDVYPEGDFLLPGPVNAASFAKLARGAEHEPSDLAHGLMGLIGENVALICCGLAAAAGIEPIVFGGTTLRNNPALVAILRGACLALGRQPSFLPEGEFVGALGALECMRPAASGDGLG